jgi:hypothetical protein
MAIPKFALTRGPKTHDELYWAIRAMWGVTVPRTQVCPHHSTPFAALAQAYFAEAPVSVWWASRGYGGKSFLLSVLTLSEAAFMGAACSLLGGSGAQSLNVHEHTLELWAAPMAPRGLIIATNKFGSTLTNKGSIRTLMASQTSVRGPHPQRLRMDEIDEMDYEILKGAQGQPMRKRGIETQTVMSSTWQYPDKTMSIILDQAKEKNWPVHAWCIASGSLVLTARGEVPIEEVERGDLVLTRKGWRPVQHRTFMGYKPTIGLRIGGRVLRATADHRIATPDGWRHAGALAADTMSPVRSDPRVLGRELVSLSTVGSSGSVLPCTPLVDAVADAFEVLGLNTSPVAADVVDRCVSEWADDSFPHPHVSGSGRPFVVTLNSLDPVAVSFGTRPVDAVCGEHGDILPVWDIGVEDEHEFVCEGVVVHNCYKETSNPIDGWLAPDEVERKRNEIPKAMWETEYELQEPNVLNRAIDPEFVVPASASSRTSCSRESSCPDRRTASGQHVRHGSGLGEDPGPHDHRHVPPTGLALRCVAGNPA